MYISYPIYKMNKLFHRKIALNIIGRQPNTLQATYDISEYLYIDEIPYTITSNKSAFYHASSSGPDNKVILNISNIATYESMTNLNRSALSAANGKLSICNMLVFPHTYIHEDKKIRTHLCNEMFLGMYYLDETYSEKYAYTKYLLDILKRGHMR